MIEQGTMYRRIVCLFAMLLAGFGVGTGYARDPCWTISDEQNTDPGDPGCDAGEFCVDWNFAPGEVINRECCPESPVGCINPCLEPEEGPRPLPPDEVVLIEAPLKDMSDLRHDAPRIPVVIDQVTFSPGKIRYFDGIPLYFLACLMPTGKPLFQAFTTRVGFSDQLQECVLGKPSSLVRGAPVEADSGVVFFDGLGGNGASYFLSSGQSLDLSGNWWDERLSSLRGLGSGTFVTIFENADFSGSSLTLATNLNWVDFSVFGWDGRASAIQVWPTPQIDRIPLLKDGSGQ